MATTRDNLIEALEGRTPETTPYSIYDWNMGAVTSDELVARRSEPEWKRLIDMGLGISHHCQIIDAVEGGVESSIEEHREGNSVYTTHTKRTPVGSIRRVTRDGWHHEDWIKTEEDYKVATWIAEHTRIEAHPERYAAAEAAVGHHGVVVMTGPGNWTHRSPAMQINVDLAGTEKFCMDVAMEEPALMELYEAKRAVFLREQELLAEMPGRYVNWLENLTINMLGPARYRDLLLSVYNEAAPILTRAGKRIFVHYDGALDCIKDAIAEAPFHGIDSLSEAPEGDIPLDVCRAAWPDKVLWANINLALYDEPEEVLRQAVMDKRERGGKQGLAFEISEDCPKNWQKAIPTVLDALAGLA